MESSSNGNYFGHCPGVCASLLNSPTLPQAEFLILCLTDTVVCHNVSTPRRSLFVIFRLQDPNRRAKVALSSTITDWIVRNS